MAAEIEVRHPNALHRELALAYLADLDDAVARRFGSYVNKVEVYDSQITDVDTTHHRKRRLTKAGKRG